MNILKRDFTQLQNAYPQQESDALLSLIQQLIWLVDDLQKEVNALKEKNHD